MNKLRMWGLSMGMALVFGGCIHGAPSDNNGQTQIYPFADIEPQWVRNGNTIEFEGKKWFPLNDYEVLQDSEVLPVGKYQGVSIFIEKIFTKPYPRIYTKFDKNKFRYWEHHD